MEGADEGGGTEKGLMKTSALEAGRKVRKVGTSFIDRVSSCTIVVLSSKRSGFLTTLRE